MAQCHEQFGDLHSWMATCLRLSWHHADMHFPKLKSKLCTFVI